MAANRSFANTGPMNKNWLSHAVGKGKWRQIEASVPYRLDRQTQTRKRVSFSLNLSDA